MRWKRRRCDALNPIQGVDFSGFMSAADLGSDSSASGVPKCEKGLTWLKHFDIDSFWSMIHYARAHSFEVGVLCQSVAISTLRSPARVRTEKREKLEEWEQTHNVSWNQFSRTSYAFL